MVKYDPLVALLSQKFLVIIHTPSSGLQRRMANSSRSTAASGRTPLGLRRPSPGQVAPPRILTLASLLNLALGYQPLAQIVMRRTILPLLSASLFGSPVFGIFGLLVPLFVHNSIKAKLARKRRLFFEQLPDTLQIVASALRAGHTIVGALAVVSSESPEPTRGEMQRVVADEQLGVPLETALERVAARMASREFEQVAIVAGLQREAGGNAAEVLDRVGRRPRGIELRQLVRSLTAQGAVAGCSRCFARTRWSSPYSTPATYPLSTSIWAGPSSWQPES